ncbi:MAG TPA: outer membrane lipoprotein carrier protein LolA [Pyrinomonadaceae bacterium]
MHKRLSLLIGALLLLACFASTFCPYLQSLPVARAAQGSEAESLINRIESRYGRMRGLAADFEQVYRGADRRERRERGRLFLVRPRRMRWEYEAGKLFVVNGRDVWFYVPADREATHAETNAVSDARFPFLFLLGQLNLRRQFRSISFADSREAADGTRTLRLVPGAGGLREVYLTVYADGRISKVSFTDEAGATSEVTLTNLRENYVAPPEAFDFRPPPGVTVRRQK